MNRYKSLVAVFAFALLVLSLPVVASAQWRDNRRNDDYYGNNRSNRNLNATIKNLKNRSRQFERRIDRELDRSRIDGTNREDQINASPPILPEPPIVSTENMTTGAITATVRTKPAAFCSWVHNLTALLSRGRLELQYSKRLEQNPSGFENFRKCLWRKLQR